MIRKGIDISSYQGIVDFGKVKEAGYEFVIIKAGQGTTPMRTFRERYLPAVEAAGLPWGAYWWTDADTVEEAKKEAAACVEALAGLKPAYPIYIDQEYGTPADKLGLSRNARQIRTDMVQAFLGVLKQKGYYGGLYTSTDWITTRLYDEQLSGVEKWVAQYANQCSYSGDLGMWQHTVIGTQGVKGKDYWTLGQVPGVPANCDTNFCYKEYPAIIQKGGWNNWLKESTPAEKIISLEELKQQGYTGILF